jgi:hypothetical protein
MNSGATTLQDSILYQRFRTRTLQATSRCATLSVSACGEKGDERLL